MGVTVGVMSKGLPGTAIPLALLLLWSLIGRETRTVRRIWSLGGVAALLVLTVPWHAVAAMKVPGFFDFYVVDNQLLRFFGGRTYVEDQQSPLGALAFWGVTFIALFPWTPCLAAALMAHSKRLIADGRWRDHLFGRSSSIHSSHLPPSTFHLSRITFLVAWAALIIGGFSLSSFKLEYYTLPAFPALALLTAAFLADLEDRGREGHSPQPFHGELPASGRTGFGLLQGWTWIAVVGGLLFTWGAAWAYWAGLFSPQNIARGLAMWATNYRIMLEQEIPVPLASSEYFGALLVGGGLLWTAGFAIAQVCLRRGRVLEAAGAVSLVGVGLCLLTGSVLSQVESHHSLKPLAEYLRGALTPGDAVIHERGLEKGGGLLFYTDQKVLVLNGTQGDLEFGSRLSGHERAFIDTESFRSLWQAGSRVFLVTHLPRTVSAVSAVSDPSPVLVARTATRWLYSNRMP
jgi:4-amino-4-deoxy-L-arabinose transferase-like glycosyltransferase